jgi:5-methylthioadenosine/S-adenosylhomocysteine deaminase
MALVLAGTVAAMARGDERASFAGRVWMGSGGLIDAVTRDGEAPPSGFDDARVVHVGDAVIYPGLIDLHSHLGYNTLPLWVDPGQTEPYLHHDIWPGEPTYQPALSWPAWTLAARAPETLLAYVQARALVGGTTTIQGWPALSRTPSNALVRCVDDDAIGPVSDPVLVSTLRLPLAALRARAPRLQGRIFIYHCAEGQPGSNVVKEFDDLETSGCLQPGLVAVHCSALDADHFARWRAAAQPGPGQSAGTVVWSPFSNLWLYRITTDVPAVLANGLGVALGTDWGPSGTRNLLGELKVARLWSDRQGWGLSAHDLARMVTCVPGDALARAWQVVVGRLEAGALADVAVVARRRPDVWENLVAAREGDVRLVVVGGQARAGTLGLMSRAGAASGALVPVGTTSRKVALRRPDDPSQPWPWADIRARLDAVRNDAKVTPPLGVTSAGRRRGPPLGDADPPGIEPLVLTLDMPGAPVQTAGPPPVGTTVQIPPIEPLPHNARWLASIRGRGFHGGVLDALDTAFS